MTAAGPRWSRRSASAGDAIVRPRLRGGAAELSLSLRLAPHPQLRRVPHGPDAGGAGGAPGHGPGPRAVVRGRVLPHLHRPGRHGVRAGRAAAPVSGMDRADRRRRRHPVRAISARRAAPGPAHARAQGPARPQAARYLGSAFVGVTFGAAWTPCIGPILGAILTLAAAQASVGHGAALLTAYSAGLALPFLLTALALDRFLAWFQRFRPYLVWVERIAGILLILLGLLLLTDRFTLLASWLQGLTPEFLRSRL